ncbi:putative DNA repair helicase [Actinacidiphila reveromycinica]|uniref:Putative DNA repair helicase n=1 Tax=Actinacidiphila reveromycinica TaxID=659352 RepID=A0A7U3USU4_9ACTN|nr:DEAD/DEAH box helicase family protein [Streptomyces sp. SN-593]BBA98126.1 putative DNA repair helicase [Streptomyces sp. SN-593]
MSAPPFLRDCGAESDYRSDRNNIVEDFYLPALAASTAYDRAVGYFAASVIATLGQGIDEFTARGGTMRIIASPYLAPADIKDIENGYELREVLQRAALRDLEHAVEDARAARGLGKLGQLVAENRVDFKLAYIEERGRVGMYHEKIGVFRDGRDVIAFKGSANETRSGLVGNFEAIEVYRSWDPSDTRRAARIGKDFEDLWENRTQILRVIPFTEAAKVIVERSARATADRYELDDLPSGGTPIRTTPLPPPGTLAIPPSLEVRDYQKEAVQNWFHNQCRGILRMATGTGKTLTALSAAAQLGTFLRKNDESASLLTVIVAPYQHLVDQWAKDIEWFGVTPLRAYESTSKWSPRAHSLLQSIALRGTRGGVIVTTNATFGGDAFQTLLSSYRGHFLLIADEAHNLGATHLRTRLPEKAQYRLGLSATPERWFDEEGTEALTGYFDRVVFEMGIGEAIGRGALCHYTYTPILVELDHEEAELYAETSAKIARLIAAGTDLKETADRDSPLGRLLKKRADIIGHAHGKLEILNAELEKRRDTSHQLIYCAEGKHPLLYEHGTDGPRQIDQVMEMVGNELRMPAARYTSETKRSARLDILRRFESNDLQVISSMRCLDEGVDVPASRTAYLLSSSSNPRQFIQRRGRVLRKAPGKERADIIDFVVVPPAGGDAIRYETERSLLRRELARVEEFAFLADNEGDTLNVLRPVRERYGLFDT